jgi:hypothetical protein
MIVKVNAGYRLKSDTQGWAVEKLAIRTRKDGEQYEDWTARGFTGTLEAAMRLCIRVMVRDDDGEYGLDNVVPKIEAFAVKVEKAARALPKKPKSNVILFPQKAIPPEAKKATKKKTAKKPAKKAAEKKTAKKKRTPKKSAKRVPKRVKR